MATSPSRTAGVAIVAIVLVLGGATALILDGRQEGVSEPSSGPPEATYTVTGNLSLYGFSPTPGGDYVDASTLTVRMGNLSQVPDASGALVQAINITLRTDEHSATYWTHPTTGDLITVTAPDKRQRYDLGTTWNWSVSGTPSPFKPGEPWPDRVPLASGSLSLANSTSPLDPLSLQADPWIPPAPTPSQTRTWNEHHPPSGQSSSVTPINRAIEGGRDNDPTLDRWLNAHDDWQVVYAVLASNPGLASAGQDTAGHWTLYFEAGNGDKIARKVIERTYAEQGDVALRTYEVQEWENLDSDLWITPQAASLMGLTDTWQQLYRLAQDEEILFTAYWQVPEGGLVEEPIWLAGIFYKGEKQGDTRLLESVTVNLETGLFHSYTGRGDPRDVLGPS